MMGQWALKVSIPVALLLFATAGVAAQKDPLLQLPVASAEGSFTGTFSINRFEVRENAVVAVEAVAGSIGAAGRVLVGEIASLVTVGQPRAPAAASKLAV